ALADVYPTDRALRPGDLVRFDLGCLVGPYRSDISRTAVLGAPSDKQARYYTAILAGERAAIAAMKPGVPVSRLFDSAVRHPLQPGSRGRWIKRRTPCDSPSRSPPCSSWRSPPAPRRR